MLICLFLSVTVITTATNSRRIKESASSSTTLENLLLELVSAYENGIRNEDIIHSRPSKVLQRRNISLPVENRTLKYSFSIRGSLDNLKSPVIHLYKTKNKKCESSNRSEAARYKLLTKRTNEEFVSYLDRLIEEKNSALRDTEEKISAVKRRIGKARLTYEQKIFQRPKDNADLVTKLVKKESTLKSQLTERLNTYLASASRLILPISDYSVPLTPYISDPISIPVKSRSARAPNKKRHGRSTDVGGLNHDEPFLRKEDLQDITSMIWGRLPQTPLNKRCNFEIPMGNARRRNLMARNGIEHKTPLRIKNRSHRTRIRSAKQCNP